MTEYNAWIHSWRKAFGRIIPLLQFVARTTCQLSAKDHQSPVFSCPGGSDESRQWEVDLGHASSRMMAGHRLELRSRSGESGLQGHHQGVWNIMHLNQHANPPVIV